jgi:hypothetical protein
MKQREVRKIPYMHLGYLLLIFISAMILSCTGGEKIPEITANLDACVQCNMIIGKLNEACGYFAQDEFHPFDSPGCLLKEYENLKNNSIQPPPAIYFVDYTTRKFLTADSTFFLITDHIPTVMNAGVLCFASKETAGEYVKYPDEKITDWRGFQTLKGTPDRIINITVSSRGMEPDVVVLEKNELVEWVFFPKDLKGSYEFYLKGYDVIGRIKMAKSNGQIAVRMFANKPGAGFPFINAADEKPVGMVKVMGAHTADEESM